MKIDPLQQNEAPRPGPLGDPAGEQTGELDDLRFRALAGSEAWARLPEAVRRRFSKRLAGSGLALYRGEVIAMEVSSLGRLLSQLCRPIGAPLPLCRQTGVPALVGVSEDAATGGQCWTRVYGRPNGFPQVIHSAKRFCGPTGLEEYLGRGIGMALRVETMADGIAFISDHYFLQLGKRRLRLPRWLSPGRTCVIHRDLGAGAFLFELELVHPAAGNLLRQIVRFEDV